MMGGKDIVVRPVGGMSDSHRRLLLRLLIAAWPRAVIEDVDSEEPEPVQIDRILRLGKFQELLVYRDRKSMHKWQSVGFSEENNKTMIHVLADDDSVTMVVDSLASKTGKIALDIENAMRNNQRPTWPKVVAA